MRRLRLLVGIIAGLGLTAAVAHSATGENGQVSVSVGDGIVNAAKLKPYDNAFVFNAIMPDGQRSSSGIWTDQLRMRDLNGRKLWVRTQTLGYFDGRVISSANWFDPVTFAPVRNTLINPDGSRETWTFDASGGEGHITDVTGHETVTKVPAKNPSFDLNCCMRSLLPAALPLATGKTFALPTVPAEGDPDIVLEHVRGREKISAGYLGMIDAWVVDSAVPGGGTVTFWIADNPPYMVHMTLKDVPANKTKDGTHYDQSYDMIGGAEAPR